MFDWNDEEIANIIWGGAGESGDHIVPYPERGEEDGPKQLQNQESLGIKPAAEHKLLGAKLDFHGIRPESNSPSNRNGHISSSGLDSWPDMASSKVANADHGSLDDKVFDDSALINKYFSKEVGQNDRNPEAYANLQGKELNDFVEYGWENIGSFDDLDRIFSNDEPLFSSVTLGSADEIWSSSKNRANSPPKSFSIADDSPVTGCKSLSKTSETMQIKSKYGQGGRSVDISFEKMGDSASLSLPQKSEISDLGEGGEDESKRNLAGEVKAYPTSSHLVPENILTLNEFANKVYGQKTLLKGQKKVRGKAKGKLLSRFRTTWSPPVNSAAHYKHQLSASLSQACFPSSFSQLRQVEGPEAFNYQPIPNSYMTPSGFANYANPIVAIPPSSHYQSGELNCQTVFPGYEVTSTNVDITGKQLDSPAKAPFMTPQEKIEKLRRKQQMQAMLAIQKQLQHFGDQVSPNSVAQKTALGSPNQLKPGPGYDIDNLSALPSVDISSSVEQDESSTLSAAAAADGYSIEETVLHRLQDIISNLDMTMRISIRDSLFRLAKSAVQRQQTSDVNSTSTHTRDQHEVVVKEEHDASTREVKVEDVETDTNPIDRAVAHLLFHRPMELSIKHPETLESSMSAKFNLEWQAQSGPNLKRGDSGKSSKTDLTFSSRRIGSPCQQHMDCMDTSENALDYGTLVGGATEAGAA